MKQKNDWDIKIEKRVKLMKSIKCKPVLDLLQIRLTRLLLKRVLEDLDMQIELKEEQKDMFIDRFWTDNKEQFNKVMEIFGAVEVKEMKKIPEEETI